MYLIECKKNLKPHHIKEFVNQVNDQDSIATLVLENDEEHIFEASVKDLRKLFENEDVYNCITDPIQQIDILAGDVNLRFAGTDYQWYARPVRGKLFKHVADLFEEKVEVKRDEHTRNEDAKASLEKSRRQKDTTIYKVAIGTKSDNAIHDIEKMEGTQKEVVEFINKMSTLNRLRSFGRAVTVFCINWKFEDDLNDIDNWKTMSELTEEGVFSK